MNTMIPMSQHKSSKYQKRNCCQFIVAVHKCNAQYNWNTKDVFLKLQTHLLSY